MRRPGIDRRTWLAGASALAAALPIACRRAPDNAPAPPLAATLLGDLGPGSTVEQWRIVAVHPVRHGALPIVLAGQDGKPYQVDVLARDPNGAPGVANTPTLSLFVVNRGDGGTPTDEAQGLGAMALARALAARPSPDAAASALSTFAQRAAAYPNGARSVPLG